MSKKVREVIDAMETSGWTKVRQSGSHRQFVHPDNPNTVTVAGKPGDDVPVGTLASIRRKTGLEQLR